MTRRPTIRSAFPGLVVVTACAAAAFVLARLPGAAVLGPLVLALLVAALFRATVLPGRELGRLADGARIAAGPLLKLGIVALGARLDLRAVVELGPWMLAGSGFGAVVAFAVAELVGRALRVPSDLRRATGMGTAICGASAIAAAAPVLRASALHTSASIGAISLLGTLGVVAFAAWDALAEIGVATFGALAGATLQEVGQVVAAGSVAGAAGADLALLVKLSRVVLLAPALVALSWWSARGRSRATAGPVRGTAQVPARRWPLPPFVLGFLALGAAVSAGLVDAGGAALLATLGTLATAAAMAGIGLGLDTRALRGSGRQALVVGLASFLALLLTMIGYYAFVL